MGFSECRGFCDSQWDQMPESTPKDNGEGFFAFRKWVKEDNKRVIAELKAKESARCKNPKKRMLSDLGFFHIIFQWMLKDHGDMEIDVAISGKVVISEGKMKGKILRNDGFSLIGEKEKWIKYWGF